MKRYISPQIAIIITGTASILAGTMITDKPTGDYSGRVNSKAFVTYFDEDEE